MPEAAWFESYFGEDYLEIHGDAFSAERTAAEVDGIVALLGLDTGARVLDLACGQGRHALPLAKRGYRVTGYDLSAVLLERARREAVSEGAEVRWVRGDMRELPFAGEFDAAINVFTAFGYFEDPRDDVETLRRIRASLAPGGRFLLETLHRDGLIARFEPFTREETSTGATVTHERSWDLARGVLDDRVTLVQPNGRRAEYRSSLRLRPLHELIALLEQTGLEPTAWYGGLDGRPLELSSHRLALVSTRGS